MLRHVTVRTWCLPAAVVVVAMLAGCGDSLSGVYTSEEGFFDKLDFTSGDTVEITFMGSTKEGAYAVEDGKVKITVDGETQVFTLDKNDCLDGGGMLGVYCKGGR